MDTDQIPADVLLPTASVHTIIHKSASMSRMQLIPRGERRRRWTVEQKQTIAAQSMAPGASPTEVAREHDIGTGQLYNWRRALMAAEPQAVGRFARVGVAPRLAAVTDPTTAQSGSAPARLPSLIEIVLPDGTAVRVDAQIDPRALRRVLATLRG
jgi:transposase